MKKQTVIVPHENGHHTKSRFRSKLSKYARAAEAHIGLIMALAPVALSLIYLLLCTMRYYNIDDVIVARMLSSSADSGYTGLVGTALGTIIARLYAAFPSVNWYAFTLFSVLTLSFSALGWVFSRCRPVWFFAVSLLCLQLLFLCRLSFTHTAYIGICAAICLLLATADCSLRKCVFIYSGAALLLFVSASIRPSGPLLSLCGLFAPACLFVLLKYKFKRIAAVALLVVLAVGILFVPAGITDPPAEMRDEVRFYNEFKHARAGLTDYGRLEYSDDTESIGISENDLNLYYLYIYGDKEFFTPELLENASNLHTQVTQRSIGDFFTALFADRIAIFMLGGMVFFSILLLNARKKAGIYVLLTAGMFCALAAYLYFNGRMPKHVMIALEISAFLAVMLLILLDDVSISALFTLPELKKESVRASAVQLAAAAMTAICMIALFYSVGEPVPYTVYAYSVPKHQQTYYEKLYDPIEYAQEQGCDYLFTPRAQNQVLSYLLNAEIDRVDIPDTNTLLGDLDIYSPGWECRMIEKGYADYLERPIFLIMKENMVVFVTDEYEAECLATYISEHSGIPAEYEVLTGFDTSEILCVRFSYTDQ